MVVKVIFLFVEFSVRIRFFRVRVFIFFGEGSKYEWSFFLRRF